MEIQIMQKNNSLIILINKKTKQKQKTKHAYIHRTKTKTNLSWLPIVFVVILLSATLRETKGGCVRKVTRGQGWVGLCLAQGPNLNFRLLVLFLLFYVSLQKKKNVTYTNFLRMYTIVHIKCTQLINDCTQFYTFNVYNFSIIVQNCVYTMYKNFQRISIILSIQCSHFSKNVLNFVYLIYTNFQRLYISLYIQCT